MDLTESSFFEVKGRNEIGDISNKQLIIEIMGRHSNIILVDREKKMILDSIKHISLAVNTHRVVMPGQEYILPPQQNKLDPFQATEGDILKKIDFNAEKLDKQLVDQFAGFSPLIAKEVVFQAGIANQVTLPKTFLSWIERMKNHDYKPSITHGEGKESFYLYPLSHISGNSTEYPSLSELLDRYYFGKAERDRVKQQATDVERFIINEKEKNEKKIKKLQITLNEAKKADEYQLYGELLTANLYAVQKGMKEIEVINYYDEDSGTITIPLNPQKSPSENAQKYFTKYQKAKTATIMVSEQMEKAKEEVAYFETLIQQVETASPKDIAEIREELIEGGYLRGRKNIKKKKLQNHKPTQDRYISSNGTEILVGKNNKQNDYLTNKLAEKDEIWLHTKDIPGSHVVIRSKEADEQTIIEAAHLAAYFSKAKNSSSVPVDYTLIRHVKKPNGAKPGFVIYDNQQTIYVTPDEEMVLKLKG